MSEREKDLEYRLRELHASLDRRIESAERGSRQRWIFVSAALLSGLAGLGVALFGLAHLQHAYVPGEVAEQLEARSLVIRDAEGMERGGLRVDEDGDVSLYMKDGNAKSRLRLSVLADGSPGVSLLDGNGDTRAILGFLPDGTTTLVFADAGAVARSVLALTPDGASRIVFSDLMGETRAAVGVDPQGRPEVSTLDADEGSS